MTQGHTTRTVRYDAATHANTILAELDALVLALQQPAWREATGEAWLARVARGVSAVRARLNQPFCLLVVGDFKRGKSTLINALLGRPLVTMDIAPETVVVTELHHGPTLRVQARLADGGRVELHADDLPSGRLAPILENLPGPVDVLRIEAPIPLLDGVTIVDSPGTGDLLWRFDRRVQEYLPRADAVLHVVSAISPLSETERAFLRLSLRPLDLAKIVFVVNQIDQIRAAGDVPRLLERVTDGLRPLFPDSPVIGVSALHALARASDEELPAPHRAAELDAAFAELGVLLDRRVLLHRDVVRNERGAHEAEVLVERAAAELARLQRTLEMDRGALREALLRARDDGSSARRGVVERERRVRDAIRELGEQAATWMDGLVTRLETEALPQLALAGHEDAQRHFPFFLAETLRDGLAACVEAHQEQILRLVEDVSREAAESLDDAVSPERMRGGVRSAAERASFHTPAWTVFDHLHTVSLLLNSLTLGLASVFAGALDRTRGQAARAEQFRTSVAGSFPALREQVAAAVRAAYDSLATEVGDRVRDTQEQELARVEGELSQALVVHDRGVERIGEAARAIASVLDRLSVTQASFTELRQRLRAAAEAT